MTKTPEADDFSFIAKRRAEIAAEEANPRETGRVPWSAERIDELNRRQQSGTVHPYTCGIDSNHRVLRATPGGWVCDDCDYRQDWALP